MKNLLSVVLLTLGFTLTASAQLFVQPTPNATADDDPTYIYVNDTFLYVNEDVELVKNQATTGGELYPSIALRNQAQLLQRDDTRANSGTGNISVYQEGTTDNYDYNFWASPVGLATDNETISLGGSELVNGPTADAGGNGNFSHQDTKRIIESPATVLTSNVVLTSASYNGTSNNGALTIAQAWIYSFKSSEEYSQWESLNQTTQLPAGWGFTMKGVSGDDTTDVGEATENNPVGSDQQRYDFRGRANNGTINNVLVGPNKVSLVGNPYPSAMDLSYFLLENSQSGSIVYQSSLNGNITIPNAREVTTGIAYFWESDPAVDSHNIASYVGGYGTFSPMSSPFTEGMYVEATYHTYNVLGESTGNTGDSAGDSLERRFTPIGQGFFVAGADVADQEQEEIIFSNRHRIYVQEGNNSDFRSMNTDVEEAVAGIGIDSYYGDVNNMDTFGQLRIAVGVNDTYTRQLGLGILDWATEGFDPSMDAENIGILPTDASFDIEGAMGTAVDNGFVINGIPYDKYQWVPMMVKAEGPTEFKFKVFETKDFPYENVYLYDRLTNEFHDILNGEVLYTLLEGDYRERFYVRFSQEAEEEDEDDTVDTDEETTEETIDNEDLSVDEQAPFEGESILEKFTIVQNNTAGQLEIYNPENRNIQDVSLFDLSGKQVFKEINIGDKNEFIFGTRNLATGIYVVQFTLESGLRKGRKVSVNN